MKNLILSRCALSVCVTAAALSGCGGSQLQTGAQGLPSMGLQQMPKVRHADGGAFSADYKGVESGSDCTQGRLMPNFGFNPYMDFNDGEGHASFLHASVENGWVFEEERPSGCFPAYGLFSITSVENPHDMIKLDVLFLLDGTATYDVISGTGRFAKATGSGTWAFTLTGTDSYEDKWTGTLSF
jgi:hypothetical protein